jgi:chemotaxis protein MotB
MSKNCHCKKHHECEECPEWIFTFADLVMLMMGFFVILWVLKPPAGKDVKDEAAEKDWLNTVGEIRKGFGYEPNPQSADPVDKAMIMRQSRGGKNRAADNETHSENPAGVDHNPTSIRPGKQSAVGARILFDANDAHLKPEATVILDQISDKIRGHYNIVMIKGHIGLDDLPDGGSARLRMDLSLRRGLAVEEYLIAHGVQEQTLRVQGCSTSEPVKQRDYNADAQAQNRRVEVEVTYTLVEERQDRTAGDVEGAPLAAIPASASSRKITIK